MRNHVAGPQALLSIRILLINVQTPRSQNLHCCLKSDFHSWEEHLENNSSKTELTRKLSCVHGQPKTKAMGKCCPRVIEGVLSSRHSVLLMSSIMVHTQYSGYNTKTVIRDSLRKLHGCQSLSVHPVTHPAGWGTTGPGRQWKGRALISAIGYWATINNYQQFQV